MLVLTRKSQEQIRIGDNIVVTVLRVKGNSVRVGVEAPREVRVVRGELPPRDCLVSAAGGEPKGDPRQPVAAEAACEESEAASDSEAGRSRSSMKQIVAAAIAHAAL